jgi:hypothetical protein
MDIVRMITKRIAIEGEWFTIQIHKHEDGDIRLEMVHDVKGKFYKMYPDNIIKESEDG